MQPIDIIAHKLQPALAECALRNQTAHEYPAHPELVLANLQQLLNHVPILGEVEDRAKDLSRKAQVKQKLGWVPEITVQEMCKEMVAHDLAQAKQHTLLKANGYAVNVSVE